ncbi:hypothetical protein [Vibrio owensii]|uniref:hypothetical protein n=1 Tax=Vibrio owensii TaxID=696485 RepID=UPI0018F1188F|nr:hypothetical protein [Vibrio owensii]
MTHNATPSNPEPQATIPTNEQVLQGEPESNTAEPALTTQDAQSPDKCQMLRRVVYVLLFAAAVITSVIWYGQLLTGEEPFINAKYMTQLNLVLTYVGLGLPTLMAIKNMPEQAFIRFLDLDRTKPLNFPTVSGFIQEQTVGGFGATVIAMTLTKFGPNGAPLMVAPAILALHLLLMYLLISYIRFIYPIGTDKNGSTDKVKYLSGALISFLFVIAVQFVLFSAEGFKF